MKRGSIACLFLLLAAAACVTGPRAMPAPPEPAAQPDTAPAPPPLEKRVMVIADSPWRRIRTCVMEDGMPREVTVQYNTVTGDTIMNERPLAEAYPLTAAFAAEAPWFVDHLPIAVDGYTYVHYALPRILSPGEIVPLGRSYQGVPLYGEPGEQRVPPSVIFVPLRPGCEFQAYQWDLVSAGVRG